MKAWAGLHEVDEMWVENAKLQAEENLASMRLCSPMFD